MTPKKPRRNRAKRPYHRSGRIAVARALPHLMERVRDPAIADGTLSPIELAAREWRQAVLADLGGAEATPATLAALLDAATGSKILLDSLDRYVFLLAEQNGLVNRRNRRVFAIVADRMRVADGLTRQLQALGLERRAKTVPRLEEYVAERYGRGGGEQEGADTSPEPGAREQPGGRPAGHGADGQ